MILHWYFLRFIFGDFAFIMIRQFRSDKKRGKRGVRSGKVLEPGFELKMPVGHRVVCWRAAHAAISDDKNLKVLILNLASSARN